MTSPLPLLPLVAAFGLAGLGLGLAYFAMVRWTVLLLLGPRGVTRAVLLTLVRFAFTVLALWLAARQGAVPLLAAGAGFLVARPIALSLYGRAP